MASSHKPNALLPLTLGSDAQNSSGPGVPGLDGSGTVASGQSEHALLSTGQISLSEYMDMAVDRALAHLTTSVSEARLQLMREVLRGQLEQDPHLSRLVEQAASAA